MYTVCVCVITNGWHCEQKLKWFFLFDFYLSKNVITFSGLGHLFCCTFFSRQQLLDALSLTCHFLSLQLITISGFSVDDKNIYKIIKCCDVNFSLPQTYNGMTYSTLDFWFNRVKRQ